MVRQILEQQSELSRLLGGTPAPVRRRIRGRLSRRVRARISRGLRRYWGQRRAALA